MMRKTHFIRSKIDKWCKVSAMCHTATKPRAKKLELQIGTAVATTITVCSQEICLQLDDYLIVYAHSNKTSSNNRSRCIALQNRWRVPFSNSLESNLTNCFMQCKQWNMLSCSVSPLFVANHSVESAQFLNYCKKSYFKWCKSLHPVHS